MGCLSSDDLKEREKVLVSIIMIAQTVGNRWSELLTSAFDCKADQSIASAPSREVLWPCEQSCTESWALACHG
jgi:hypothetical protein